MEQSEIREKFEKMSDGEKEIFTMGRISILNDFDAVCMADAFVGFTEEEWRGIKKFFEFNKIITNQ